MVELANGSQETLTAAIEAERAIQEAQKGAELVAGAAEEQASAASEAQSAVRQQAQSLEQGQVAAQSLASLSEDLRGGDCWQFRSASRLRARRKNFRRLFRNFPVLPVRSRRRSSRSIADRNSRRPQRNKLRLRWRKSRRAHASRKTRAGWRPTVSRRWENHSPTAARLSKA